MADLLPDVEFRVTDVSGGSFPVGQTGRRMFEITCRRLASRGRGLPEAVRATPPLSATLTSRTVARTTDTGITEESFCGEVLIAADKVPGPKKGAVSFKWPDGHEDAFPLTWDVTPVLKVTPSSLVVAYSSGSVEGTEPIEKNLVVTSEKAAFRVLRVSSDVLDMPVESASDSSTVHRLRIRIDPKKSRKLVNAVEILTDCADQPVVSASVITLSRPEAGPKDNSR